MAKDWHLIEAALSADRLIASLDEEARFLFRRAAVTVRELREVVWVNPERHVGVMDWLAAGARPDRRWMLGSGGHE